MKIRDDRFELREFGGDFVRKLLISVEEVGVEVGDANDLFAAFCSGMGVVVADEAKVRRGGNVVTVALR